MALPASLGPGGVVLEIAAGSGQHTAHFASHFPDAVWQATDPDSLHLKSIQAWISASGITNAPHPIHLDTRERPWPINRADVVLCINMIHISPWESCASLFEGSSEILSDRGIIYLYGPFSVGGEHTAESNATFDESLRARDPAWGVRDIEDVSVVAGSNGFGLSDKYDMPSNNMSLVYKRSG